jgi:hypothetical protein
MGQLQITQNTSVSGAGTVTALQQVGVRTRANWSDGWVQRPYLEVISHLDTVAPSVGSANFKYHYGSIKREDTYALAQYNQLDLAGHWVQVYKLSNSEVVWTGRFQHDNLAPAGGARGSGVQNLIAYGLAHELDRTHISWAQAETPNGTASIDVIPPINYRSSGRLGNRSTARNSDGVYEFSSAGELWTNLDVAEMILALFTPENGPTFELGGDKDVLSNISGIYELQNRTPWDVLNELIDRRRGLGFVPVVMGETVVLRVYTVTDEAIVVGGVTIPANSNQVDINLDTSIKIVDPVVIRSVADLYQQIEVRGGPIVSCFTIAAADDTVDNQFDAFDVDDYLKACSTLGAYYASLSDEEKANANDNYRQDDRHEKTFAKFGLSPLWDGTAGDGAGGTKTVVLPFCSDEGEISLVEPGGLFMSGKGFEDWLPLEEGKDYSVVTPTDLGVSSGTEPTYKRPFALVKDPNYDEWHFVDRPGPEYRQAAAHFTLYRNELCFGVHASPRHLYAKDVFTQNTAAVYSEDSEPVFKYTDILATVALKTDQVILATANSSGGTSSDVMRKKLIEIPNAEYWYCAPGTVIGINRDLTLKRYGGSGVLRDDRPRLWEIAASAAAWYSRPRNSLSVGFEGIEHVAELGSLLVSTVTAGTTLELGTVITSREVNYAQGGRTRISTSYAEIDWSLE